MSERGEKKGRGDERARKGREGGEGEKKRGRERRWVRRERVRGERGKERGVQVRETERSNIVPFFFLPLYLIYDVVARRFGCKQEHLVQDIGGRLDEFAPPSRVVLLAHQT